MVVQIWSISSNINKYFVSLPNKYQEGDYGEKYEIDGYTREDAYKIISYILKNKDDDEEVDLVQEVKLLNLKNVNINEEKKVKKNYILIIGGANKELIDDEVFIQSSSLSLSRINYMSLNMVENFSGLLNTKIRLLENEELLDSWEFKKMFPEENHNLSFVSYDCIKELEGKVELQKDVPYNLVIDMSELYMYRIVKDRIKKELYYLDLNNIFKNCNVVKLKSLSGSSLIEISEFLEKCELEQDLYVYGDDKYYHLENNNIVNNDFGDFCTEMKKVLRKK